MTDTELDRPTSIKIVFNPHEDLFLSGDLPGYEEGVIPTYEIQQATEAAVRAAVESWTAAFETELAAYAAANGMDIETVSPANGNDATYHYRGASVESDEHEDGFWQVIETDDGGTEGRVNGWYWEGLIWQTVQNNARKTWRSLTPSTVG